MTVIPGTLRPVLLVLGCVVALVFIAFAAIRLIRPSEDTRTHAAPATTVGTAAAVSAQKPKVRYQGTIENWRKYRAASDPN